ncbi:hypothetical protein C2G38_2226459 [Gigaspora rosea]|uniref:SWIM-type domain-containing protein n=1 Tax=Gigaspora rosea TaxID=44941 RepID=A0A397TZU6_9GLOM|nr:hypothetical protein C2G38_2226459 [Gigaspora rosea]
MCESTAEKDATKKPRLVQKESKKYGYKSYIHVVLPVSSTTVQHALEELDAFSIQQLLRFRGIELQNQVQLLEYNQSNEFLQSIQQLRDGLVIKEDIYAIVYDTMKACIYLDNDEIKSLDKWKAKIIGMGECCLFECGNQEQNFNSVDIGFIFTFQTKKQIELMQYSRVLCLDGTHGMNQYEFLKLVHKDWNLDIFMVDDAEALTRWRNFGVEAVNSFADYFEYWWRPKYDKWMAFHRKLKYVYMRERTGRRLDSEVYLLAEIVLRGSKVSVFVDELKIGRMNPQRHQQRICEIVGTTKINTNDIYSVRPNIWIVHSMTNDDVEYSVRRKDSEVSNNDNLNISSYICNCRNFKSQQLPCKHIFAILNKLCANANSIEDSSHNYLIQQLESPVAKEPNNFFTYIGSPGDNNFEFTKLQEEFMSITEEWKEKKAIQVEKTKIARINVVDSSNESEKPNIAPNSEIRKQNRY